MNNLNHISLEQASTQDTDNSSTATMLTTILLLIAGLLLSSAMLSHYLLPDHSNSENGTPKLSISKFITRNNSPRPKTEQKKQSYNALLSTPWPRMKLVGFGRSEEESGNFAIINGKKVHPGQFAAGKATLVEIRDYDVIVEYKGETRILTIEN